MRLFLKTIIFTVVLVSVFGNCIITHGEVSYGISLTLIYDVTLNSGIMELKLEIRDAAAPTLFEIPLYFLGEEATFSVINLSYTPLEGYVIYEYNESTRILEIMASNISSFSAWILVENMLEEYAPGVYGFFLDLNNFSNAGATSLSMYFYGNYDVIVENLSGGSYGGNVFFSSPFTLLQIERPGAYFVLLKIKLEENTTTMPIQQHEGFFPILLLIATLLVGGSAGVVFVIWRRNYSIRLETVSARDILSDEVVRDIILALGRAGEKGLQQSELVNITGRPKSSISRRIKRLEDEGLVDVVRAGKYNYLKLTDKGFETYRKIASREKRNE